MSVDPALTDRFRALVSSASCPAYTGAEVADAVRASLAPLGGMAAFVSAGDTVLCKPNLLSPRQPEEAVTTHPAVVEAVVRLCVEAGAGRVWVGDSCAGAHGDERLWATTGMASAVAAAGGELRSFRGGVRSLVCGRRRIPVPDWYEEVDVVVSLPKLKSHLLTSLTCSLKNVYGLVCGEAKALFHGDYPSPRTMAVFLVDVFETVRPALTIVDAVVAMEGDGPAGGTPRQVGLLLAGTDAVALDAWCAGLYGLAPADVPMVREAAARHLGVADPERLRVTGPAAVMTSLPRLAVPRGRLLQWLPEWLFQLSAHLARYRPVIRPDRCVSCGVCAETCSQSAIRPIEPKGYRINARACILCMCCLEACPYDAVAIRSPLHALRYTWCRLRGRPGPHVD